MNALAVESDYIRPLQWRRVQALFLTLPLIPAADLLLYGRPTGTGWTIWMAALWGALWVSRPLKGWKWRGKDLILLVLMGLSLCQSAWRPSFSNGLVLVGLTVYAAAHFELRGFGPWWERFFAGLRALGAGPVRWLQAAFSAIPLFGGFARKAAVPGNLGNLRDFIIIFAPAVLVGGFFLVLLGSGNAILGQSIQNTVTWFSDWFYRFELPSFSRLIFWAALGTAVLGLLWPLGAGIVRQSMISRALEAGILPAPAKPEVPAWSTRMMLLSANLVFFAANTIDVVHLWTDVRLPEGVTVSQFVHQGTWNLIASVIIAAAVLSAIYQQDRRVTESRGVAVLALMWIGQNLLLIANVGLRLQMYVESFGLSVKRVHLALFLLLVVVGFVLLAIRVSQGRRLKWLFGANLLACFLLFFGLQFWDTREFVAEYNVRPDETIRNGLDLPFLVELGPSGWGALRKVADAERGSPLHRYRDEALFALKTASYEEKGRENRYGWRSMQGQRLIRSGRLPGF